MNIVLDVSTAYAVVAQNKAAKKFIPELEQAFEVSAPDLFFSEATNAAWKFNHIEDLSSEDCLHLAENAILLIDTFYPSESLWREALTLACEAEHPTYDCIYWALAKQQDTSLITLDKCLLKACKRLGISFILYRI